MAQREEKTTELIKNAAAKFLHEESSGSAMITVTHALLSSDGKYATIFITAFPEDKEKQVLDFAKRKRPEFKNYIKSNTRINRIPFFDFEIDTGEKNRQKIDLLSIEAEKLDKRRS